MGLVDSTSAVSGYSSVGYEDNFDSSSEAVKEKKYYIKGKTYTKDQFDKLCIIRYTNLTPYCASKGDTLESIANKFRVSTDILKHLNVFNNFDKIKAGDLFQLPVEVSSAIDEIEALA